MAQCYLDHNVAGQLGPELGRHGYGAVYARQLGLAGASDATHLTTAARRGDVLITNDLDFLALHAAWLEWPGVWGVTPPPTHHGILLIAQGPMGGALAAAGLIATHLNTAPHLANTLWQWIAGRGWVIP